MISVSCAARIDGIADTAEGNPDDTVAVAEKRYGFAQMCRNTVCAECVFCCFVRASAEIAVGLVVTAWAQIKVF